MENTGIISCIFSDFFQTVLTMELTSSKDEICYSNFSNHKINLVLEEVIEIYIELF